MQKLTELRKAHAEADYNLFKLYLHFLTQFVFSVSYIIVTTIDYASVMLSMYMLIIRSSSPLSKREREREKVQ